MLICGPLLVPVQSSTTKKKTIQLRVLETISGSDSKESACSAGDLGSVPGLGKPLEKGKATHSSIPTWKIPWTEEPGGL